MRSDNETALEDENPDPLSRAANARAQGRLCSFTESEFEGCAAMERALADVPVNADRKGLSVCITTEFGTWKQTFRGVAYKVSSRDEGVFLNVCPWCSGKVLPQETLDLKVVSDD